MCSADYVLLIVVKVSRDMYTILNRVVLAVFFGPWYQGPDNGTRALVRRSLMVYQSPILNRLGATGLRCYQGVLPGSFLKLVSGIQLC